MIESQARAAMEGILDQLDVKSGDRIMLGIDMGKIPLPRYPAALSRDAFRDRERKWCEFVLRVLTDRLGPSGTVLVPTFTYSCGKSGSTFELENTPSENGPFTEFLRCQPNAVRSSHPIFSLSGMGRDAPALLQDTGRSAFGAMSPFARFAAAGIRFLCLGVELHNCITYVHHLEQSYGCPHRFNKSFDIKIISKGQAVSQDWFAYVEYRGFNFCSDISPLQDALKENGHLRETEWNGCPNHLADVAHVDRVGYAQLAKDPNAFLNRKVKLRFGDPDLSSTDSPQRTFVISAVDMEVRN